jgi:hypothetical protein
LPSRKGFASLTSRDGDEWTLVQTRNICTNHADVAFNNGTFVMVGPSGNIVQSDPIIRLDVVKKEQTQVILQGPMDRSYRLEASDGLFDPNSWHLLHIFSSPPFIWTDAEAEGRTNRFYRAVLEP